MTAIIAVIVFIVVLAWFNRDSILCERPANLNFGNDYIELTPEEAERIIQGSDKEE
jgi:hypothetical protein